MGRSSLPVAESLVDPDGARSDVYRPRGYGHGGADEHHDGEWGA